MKRVVEREFGHLFYVWRVLCLPGKLLDAVQVHRPGQCRLAPDLALRAVECGALLDRTDAQGITRRGRGCGGIDRRAAGPAKSVGAPGAALGRLCIDPPRTLPHETR